MQEVHVVRTLRIPFSFSDRELFERAVHLKLSSKRMKFFFKHYLAFEEQYGNEATVLAVKEKALAYVKSVT